MARGCEDCEEEVNTRRTRCPHCGLLVCRWCYHHGHGQMSEMLAKARRPKLQSVPMPEGE